MTSCTKTVRMLDACRSTLSHHHDLMSVFAEMDDCLSDMAQTEVCSNWRSLKFYIKSAQER